MSILTGFGSLCHHQVAMDGRTLLNYICFMDAKDFSDPNKILPKIPWEKKTSGIVKIKPLSQKTDIFYIISYLMEFRGCREKLLMTRNFMFPS